MSKLLRRLAAALALAAVAVALLFLLLPFALNTWLLPALLDDLPDSERILSVNRLTPFSASGTLHLGEPEKPGIAVPRLVLTFSPLELLKKRLRSMTIDHAVLHLYRSDDRIIIPGLSSAGTVKDSRSTVAPLALPLIVDHLIIKQCSLVLHENGRTPLRLSVSADLTISSTRDGNATYRLETAAGRFALADLILARGTADLSAVDDGYLLSLDLEHAEGEVPARFVPPSLQGSRLGPVNATLSLALAEDLRSSTALDLRASFTQPSLTVGPLKVTGAEESGTVRLSVNGTPSALYYELSPLLLSSPALRLAATPRGSLSVGQDGITLTGEVDMVATRAAERLASTVSWRGSRQSDGSWQLAIDGRAGDQKPLTIPGVPATITVPAANLHADLTGRPHHLSARIDLELPQIELIHDAITTNLSGTTVRLLVEHRDDETSGDLHGAVNRVLLPGQAMELGGLELKLPYILAPPDTTGDEVPRAGSLAIGSISRQDTLLGDFSATLHQRSARIDLDGALQAAFPPRPRLYLTGSVRPAAGTFELSWQLPSTAVDAALLPNIAGIPKQLGFTGTLTADGSLQRHAGRLGGLLTASLRDGTLTQDERRLNISDLDCSLTLPHLPEIRSAPSQRCTAARIDIGNLHFGAADISYRLEDLRTLFIEKSRVDWCRGTLESSSVRLSTINPEIDTVLYSSRINFAELLNQFGFDQTEGDGALNGKLPVKWSGDQLHIDDGFLFSTPGAGGIVQFTNTDLLRQGIGTVQQAGSLGYSLKALEDFAYNWSRLSFNSFGDELLLTMELDGRPRTPLPYAFKNGALVEAQQGKLDYPIRLDINLRLPLAELLRVGYDVKSIMGNK
ncbi:intermembrane phospholipid transport protein YdbH family protein [Desulfofustis glycolicus]|uniref:Dicarboxylate transport n=1 Tax=Desulfofustis glycolicus DSM 9705 TaxID=1121409 RepID=A0A1M5UHA1_9BACT|nr:YdbH domain-containing protein [Desulfofustis glycolicus]MCB2217488.1 YdbH domain-containing protein [Desulfobulbaceae bacterium]SHH62394.1 Dicarboxylate transport [Desulfofustis glycolicus DSM 9705]